MTGLTSWALAGLLTGLALLAAYVYLIRYSLAAVPLAIAVMMIMGQARAAFMFSGAMSASGFVIVTLLLSAAAYLWAGRGFMKSGN